MIHVVGTDEPTSFTHVGPGTPAIVWRRHPEWGRGASISLDGLSRLVVLAAHPDDESLGAGGLVASATRLGIAVEIVCATDGEGSHPDSPTHTPEDLAAVRAEEARQAARALGVAVEHVHRLGLPDGRLEEHHEDLASRLVAIVRDGQGTVILSTWRRDGHPDHEAAGRAAAAAARRTGADLWEFPVWYWHWGKPEDAPWSMLQPFALDEAAMQAKRDAIRAHASQVAPLSDLEGDETLLPPELLAHSEADLEYYLQTPSAECPDDSADRQVERPSRLKRPAAVAGIGWIREIVLNTPDPLALAAFWTRLLGGAPVEWYDGWVTIEPPPHGQRLSFQRSETESSDSASGDGASGVHFDVLVADLETAHDTVVAAGGEYIEERTSPRPDEAGNPVPWRVYADPDGHRFCLVVR